VVAQHLSAAAGSCDAAWKEALRDLARTEILHLVEAEFRQSRASGQKNPGRNAAGSSWQDIFLW
jgi:hypothetical protein